ncbi:MAG: sigma-70 family RNA polymerase sigma factor [Planctomycetota bacterium]|jgi:RNA polymerase sigma factor (TIGR02999 family)
MQNPNEITQILSNIQAGQDSAVSALLPLVYEELRALGGSMFKAQGSDHTLQPTALVHEAYAKLVGASDIAWESRAHFFAVAAKAMRQILTDHARRKRAAKRGGDQEREQVTLAGLKSPSTASPIEILALEDALSKLVKWDERQYQIVELRFLGGMTMKEVAEVLELSVPTVEREWRMARAWLRRELTGDSE